MEQRYILGVLVLLIISAFIISAAARKAMRALLYLLSLFSFLLAGICIYAIINNGEGGNRDSAGLLLFIVGAMSFGGLAIGAFKYASGLRAFEKSHFDVHDRVVSPIPIPGFLKDTMYVLASIAFYFLFFASQSFYRQNIVSSRDLVIVTLVFVIYLAFTRVALFKRPLEGVSRAKESLLFALATILSLAFIVVGGLRILRSQISFLTSGVELAEKTLRGGYIKATPLDKDLKKAIVAGDVNLVKKLIQEGASLSAPQKSLEMAPLLLAMSKRQSRVAEVLIRGGAPVGDNELRYAIVNVDAPAIRLALSVNKNVPNGCKDCVQAAARLGDSALTAYLLTQLAQTDEMKDAVYQKALVSLLTMPHWESEKMSEYDKTYLFLSSKGAKFDMLIDGYLPLMSFATRMHLYEGRFTFVKKYQANLNTQDKDGNTYLHIAARGNESSYKKLLELGLDPNIKNKAGETPEQLYAKIHVPK